MIDKIWFILTLIIIALTVTLIMILRRKHSKFYTRLFSLGVGLVMVDIVILLKISTIKNSDISILISLLYAIQMPLLNTPYKDILEVINLEVETDLLLKNSFIVMSFLTPFAWASFVASLFPIVVNGIYFHFYKFFRPIYLFSELNENSLMLAEDLSRNNANANHGRKCLCVFCNVNRHDDAKFIERAEESKFILFAKQMERIIRHFSKGYKWIYFAISSNQDENLDVVKEILLTYSAKEKDFKRKLHLYLFSEQKDAPLVSSSINTKHIPLTVINKSRYIANDLFFRHPLVEALKYGGKNIGVLIIGAGKIGIELVKNCIWLGQLGKDYTLKVVVFDRDADAISERFFIEHPEVQKNYNLTFKQITMLSNNFEAELNKIYEDINYICICLGNDDLNIRVALFMRRFFMKKNSSPNRPFIAVETKNDIKAASVLELNEWDKKNNPTGKKENKLLENKALDYHLHSFARNASVFSKNLVFNDLERLARNIHFVYEIERAQTLDESNRSTEIIEETYYMSNQSINSARSRALHIASKMFVVGEKFYFNRDIDIEKIEKLFSKESYIKKLACIEHERWVAYMRCEGWTLLPDSADNISKEIYRKLREKQHYCLRPCEKMEVAEKKIGIEFKRYDFAIVRDTPKILSCASIEEFYALKFKNIGRIRKEK